MRSATRREVWSHLVALVAVGLATAARLLLDPFLGEHVPYATFFVAVGAAVWIGGLRAGLTAWLASALVVLYAFLPPRFAFGLPPAPQLSGLATFAVSSLLFVGLGETMWIARRRLAKSRERLRASEEFHRITAEIGTDFAWTARLEPDGRVILEHVTRGFSILLGYSSDELAERGVMEAVHPDDREVAERAVRRLLAGERVEGEVRYLKQDGEPIWVHFVTRPLTDPDGRVVRAIGAGRSIDEAKRAEAQNRRLTAQLEQRVTELETLLDILPVGVWQGDATCEHVTGNRAAYEALRQTPDAPASHLGYHVVAGGRELRPDDLPMQRAARTGEPVRNEPIDLVFDDGEVRSLLCNVAPLLDEEGHVRGVLAAYADVTEQARAERELREADRRKDEFLATLAHELRNPLAPIRSAAAVLELVADDAGPIARPVAVIERQVAHMARLLDDLLDVSRITRNKLELRRQAVPLASVVDAAVEAARPWIEAGAHELAVSLPDEPLTLDGDPVRLAQVLTNLLTNSAKYTDRGGHVALRVERDRGDAIVTVSDDGIGIAREMLPRVFEMFSQDQPALQRAQGGLGIGLSLARALVTLHGGSIEARSEGLGRGTCMVVRLPLAERPPAERPAEIAGELPKAGLAPSRPLRVLVADDNADAADTLAMFLVGLGHEVRTASDGVEALEVGAELEPELVLLDLGMPRMNGYEAARAMRGTPWGRRARLVAVTGWGHAEDRRRSAAATFDRHLVKPVELAELRDVVEVARAGTHAMAAPPP